MSRDIEPMTSERIAELKSAIQRRWDEKPWYQGGEESSSPGCMMRAQEILELIAAVENKSPVVTDEMVERAAKALEKKDKQDTYGWSDEMFEVWWNKDPDFITRKRVWAFFQGTTKELCLRNARITLEVALS